MIKEHETETKTEKDDVCGASFLRKQDKKVLQRCLGYTANMFLYIKLVFTQKFICFMIAPEKNVAFEKHVYLLF